MLGRAAKQQDVFKDQVLDQQDELLEQANKQQDVLKEKISEYKKAHPEQLADCDFAFFLKTLKKLAGSSRVKAAKNAFNENREWIPGTETWNVGKVFLDEDRSVAFTLRREGDALTVEELYEQLKPIDKKLPVKSTVPLKLVISEEKHVTITDLYAHSLVSDKWAGMPADLVLCFTQKKEERKPVGTPKVDE